jgi:hypothetical protein
MNWVVTAPDYKNGKHGTPESHARNDGCQPSKNAGEMKVMEEKTDDNQIRLETIQDKMDVHHTRTEANHERIMAKLGAHHERMKASVNPGEKRRWPAKKRRRTLWEPNLEEMQSGPEPREVPKEHAAVKYSEH